MKKNSVQMAVEIKTSSGSVLKPHEIYFWDLNSTHAPKHLVNGEVQSPFKYYTDAILALCYHKLTDFTHVTGPHKEFVQEAYQAFDHYTELYQKSHPRVKALGSKHVHSQKATTAFEKKVQQAWKHAFQNGMISFTKLSDVLNCISDFETQILAPLIYNFSVNFSAEFTEKLIAFYSLLFHLRSVVAVDHNAHAEDASHDVVKCDSISDYLPKADYTVNDALLYWHFKNLSEPYVGAKNHARHGAHVEKNLVTPMHQYFQQYSHNACNLIDHLPAQFLHSMKEVDLEEALHHVQMDWLLGSSSGLLFKIREELFGVLEGYDKIFWPEASAGKTKKASVLSLCFELKASDISGHTAA